MQTIYVLYTEYDYRPVDQKAFRDKQLLINHYNIEYHDIGGWGGWGKKGNPDDHMLYIEEFTLE